uniref:BHLH domain-containing protein n=1 Tax=Periophthalmus magnuspinnatus TaxID=409849 RepID=A0A3B4A7U2_9GOBI
MTFHGWPMNCGGAHYKDVLRLGSPVFDTAYFDYVHEQTFYRSVCEYTFESSFIRKRNERERHRVRCVNEGYARLREHMPHEDKRLKRHYTTRHAEKYLTYQGEPTGLS